MSRMKSSLVIGASRGIGRQIALTLSSNGYKVGVASKTVQSTEKLPGSIHSVVDEIVKSGGEAVPIQCNVRKEEDIEKAVQQCINVFGGLDLAVYNAGAIMWKKVIDTPLKNFDLMQEVNVRGAYTMLQCVLPHFLQKNSGRIILVSPPIYNRFFKGKTPYSVGKVGMTVLVHGLANELKGTGVSISALWPAVTVKSFVTEKMQVPDEMMRSPELFADAVLGIAEEKTDVLNGQALIDEDYLRTKGVTDFSKYNCVPDSEPPRIMPKKFPSLLVEEEDVDFSSKL